MDLFSLDKKTHGTDPCEVKTWIQMLLSFNMKGKKALDRENNSNSMGA